MMTKKYSYLKHFFIFNRNLSTNEEGALEDEMAEKILFFYPEDANLFEKVNFCNICEGLLDFTESEDSTGIQYVSSDTSLICFYHCEPATWMCIEVEYKQVNGVYDHNTVLYECLESILCYLYDSYIFIHGKIEPNLEEKTTEGVSIMSEIIRLRALARKYRYYYEGLKEGDIINNENNRQKADLYEPTEKALKEYLLLSPADAIRNRLKDLLYQKFDQVYWDNLTIFNMVYGFRYLSVSPSNYLDINSKITRLMYAYKNIKYMTFLFDNFIIWSNMIGDQLSNIYSHHLNEPGNNKLIGFHTFKASGCTYINVFLKDGEEVKKHVYMKYICQDITLLMLLSIDIVTNDSGIVHLLSFYALDDYTEEEVVVQFQNEFSDYIADIWKNLYPELTKCEEDLINNSIMDRSFASIYIDKTTHAISIHNFSESNRQYLPQTIYKLSSYIPPQISTYINHIFIRMQQNEQNYIHVPTGEWVCGQKVSGRILIFILSKRLANSLLEASKCVSSILEKYFTELVNIN